MVRLKSVLAMVVFLQGTFTSCDYLLEQAIQEIDPKKVRDCVAEKQVLPTMDKERYIKLAKELVESAKYPANRDLSAYCFVKKALDEKEHPLVIGAKLCLFPPFGIICGSLLILIGMHMQKLSKDLNIIVVRGKNVLHDWPLVAGIGAAQVLANLTKFIMKRREYTPQDLIYMRACAVLKILEEVPAQTS